MFLSESMQKKWAPVLEHPDLPEIKDSYRKAVTAVLLENQEKAMMEEGRGMSLFEDAPANSMGSSEAGTGHVDYVDPVLISLVRRSMPQLIAYDVCGVQPMSGPTGLIFAMRSRYSAQDGTESGFNEANTRFAGDASATGNEAAGETASSLPAQASMSANAYRAADGLSTAAGEALGDSGTNHFAQMAFSIEKVTVTAKTRALKGEYSMELAQDLKAVHGLDAETELSNILSSEVLAEINREVIRTIYNNATTGAQDNVANGGTFDMDVDSNGRWMVEKFKGLLFQIEREANADRRAHV